MRRRPRRRRSPPSERGSRRPSSRPCCPGEHDAATRSSRSTRAPAARNRRTGPRCSYACTCAGPSGAASRSTCSTGRRATRPGIKSATLDVVGPNAYGYLKAESGVHRLVRISPFDAAGPAPHLVRLGRRDPRGRRRHRDRDRRQGPPGRHLPLVRRRRPARQRHRLGGAHHAPADRHRRDLPERALAAPQPRRRDGRPAREALRAGARGGRGQEAEEVGEKKKIEWGSQIRSYVLAPYRMVKDHRTGFEVGDADRVLDGDLDGFIRAFLTQRARGQPRAGCEGMTKDPIGPPGSRRARRPRAGRS